MGRTPPNHPRRHQTPQPMRLFRSPTASLLSGTRWRSPGCSRCPQCPSPPTTINRRHAYGTSSSAIWLERQMRDPFTKKAALLRLRSRAAFKLLEIHDNHDIFRPGQTIVDLGYAPGSWSQVAMDKVSPSGRVIGVDVIHSPPPTGVSTIQGNFLDSQVQDMLRDFVANPARGRPLEKPAEKDYIALERSEGETSTIAAASTTATPGHASDESHGRHVHVVLSDMSEPWPPLAGFLRSLTVPYRRLMNVSGAAFRDHAGSMDLCTEALRFALRNLKRGGHFVCKFYAGPEDDLLEHRLKDVFRSVDRSKPESSRKESKENYFVAKDLKLGSAERVLAGLPAPRHKI